MTKASLDLAFVTLQMKSKIFKRFHEMI